MTRVFLTQALRTPIGRFLGQFRDVAATELGQIVAGAVHERAGRPTVDRVLFGCARQAGLGPNPARQVAIRAGLPDSVPAVTLNMACGSGLLAIIEAARQIRLGEAEVILAGGMENMTRVPHLLPGARLGYRMGHDRIVDAMYQDGFHCPLADQLMGATAETLARRHEIGRDEQDAFAARSQQRAEAAIAAGHFSDQIVPVTVQDRRKGPQEFTADEHPRSGVTAASLGKLAPVFDPEGGVTAGNSSGVTDGAAAVLVMSERAVEASGATPLVELEGWADAGIDPSIMGIGPVPATRKLMEGLDLDIDAFDLVELNEAFAAQVIACLREMPIEESRLNVNGGSIALGHPIGMTGTRIVVTLVHELLRRGDHRGLATLCISGGMGLSLSLKRVSG